MSDDSTHLRVWGPPVEPDGPRERWERRVEWPLVATAVLFLVVYATPILWVGMPGPWRSACRVIEFFTYLAFVVDYVARFLLSRNRIGFLRHSILDLLVVLLPMLRPLRTLRLVTLLQILDRRIGRTLRGQVVTYLALATALVVFIASLAVLDAERKAPHSNITSFADALWWAATTITTVGYGEHHPVTGVGRVVAACLMFSGIALLGVVTASIASWMVERLRDAEEEAEALTRADIEVLTDEIRALRREVEALRDDRGTTPPRN